MIRGIKVVFFDVYKTLARFDPPVESLQVETCEKFGISVSVEGIAFGNRLADDYMAKEKSAYPIFKRDQNGRDKFFSQYERLVLYGAGVDVSLRKALKIFKETQRTTLRLVPFTDVKIGLGMLLAKRVSLGVITNIDALIGLGSLGDTGDICSEMGLSGYFDVVVTSQEAGNAKPHAGIFRFALDRMGLEPEQAIHVGDQYYSDVVGARAVGMFPVLIDRDNDHEGFQECPRIRSIVELCSLVGGEGSLEP